MMRTLPLLTIMLLVLSSCSNQELIRPGDSLEEAFEKAYTQFENERWVQAADAFSTVVESGRGTAIGQEAQYYLAESYFRYERYLSAAAEFERYSSLYIDSPRREEVDFKIALSYYHLSPRYRLDQAFTRRAIEYFRLFNSRHQNSERVNEAGEYIDELRNKLARKQFNAAEFYMRTNRFSAAAIYFARILDQYPESDWAEPALMKQMEAYILYADNSVEQRKAERYRLALESYDRYLQLFPSGNNREEVERLYSRTLDELDSLGESADGTEITQTD